MAYHHIYSSNTLIYLIAISSHQVWWVIQSWYHWYNLLGYNIISSAILIIIIVLFLSNQGSSYMYNHCFSYCLQHYISLLWLLLQEHSYLLAEGWSDFQTDSEWVSDSVRRQESQKGDFPLHHMRRISQDPSCPNSLLNTNMLKADHGQLHFTSDEQTNNL